MNERFKLSRRVYLRQALALGAVAVGAPLAAGCGRKSLSCEDTSALAASDAQTRTMLHYVDKSPIPDKVCSGCQQFKPAGENSCGGCQVVKGPINPAGYCNSWVKKTS